ncbi:MAG: hypothetical protein AAGK09_09305 [Planctomycetota bacterium]
MSWRHRFWNWSPVDRYFDGETESLRKDVAKAVKQRFLWHWRWWGVTLPVCLAVVFGWPFFVQVLRSLGMPGWLDPLLFVAFMLPLTYFMMRVQFGLFRDTLYRIATERGLRPVRCIRCDYDLRGLDRADCPECGQRIPGLGDRAEIS